MSHSLLWSRRYSVLTRSNEIFRILLDSDRFWTASSDFWGRRTNLVLRFCLFRQRGGVNIMKLWYSFSLSAGQINKLEYLSLVNFFGLVLNLRGKIDLPLWVDSRLYLHLFDSRRKKNMEGTNNVANIFWHRQWRRKKFYNNPVRINSEFIPVQKTKHWRGGLTCCDRVDSDI